MSNVPELHDQREWNSASVLASLVVDSSLAVFGLDIDGTVMIANDAAHRLTGNLASEMHGRTLSSIFGSGIASNLAHAIEGAESNSAIAFQTTVERPLQAPLPVQVTVIPERGGASGIAVYVLLAVTNDGADPVDPIGTFDVESASVEAIFNSGTTGILFFDLAGTIFGANPALKKMLAYDEEALIGKSVVDLVHEPDRLLPNTSLDDPFAGLVAGERDHYQAVRRYRHSDGHLVWAHVTVSAVHGADNEILYFISIMQDVTELKLLEDVAVIANEMADSFESALAAIVEELAVQLGFEAAHVLLAQESTNRVLPTGIWYLKKPGMLPNFCALTGATTFSPGAGHVGKVFANRVATLDRDLQASSESLRIAAAIDDGLKTGLFVPMIIHGDVVGVIEFYSRSDRDVDSAMLETLTRIAPQLGWFVERERARQAVEQKSNELERSNRDLDRFASVASHDLQEPLRAIGRGAHILADRFSNQLGEDGAQLIHFITDGADRMEKMIVDLLRYSRISTGVVDFVLVDLNDVVGDALGDLQVAIEENGATIEVAELPSVLGSETQLRNVFQNLIGNALKYRAEAAPRIVIDVRPSGSAWLFSIRDNGIGIDPAYHDQIFDIFRRLHGRNQYTGTGIGLAIVKRVIEQHQGRLWVESAEGQGSTFFFTLPIPGGENAYDGDTETPQDSAAR